ncbi:MAG: DUF262 domain-containing HNH endonuclease family protein [Azonexus sp.]|jgi:hypothetical protein|uniref:DUF262 domain-containing protein n=1 Tax=Azonexus sp. TaxID=1872668 RepID=UPI002820D754|nr:DUF262 domain-containing HNH endonuclease family protein [Azonexus sp.]MDR0776690.1 DUF262 domain-containing HNH endonuclease family protein [Azonexus sp.]
MIDISKAFSPTSEPISGFFQQPGAAYYIPLYQREYSWEAENVEQLMEDVFNGVKSLIEDSPEIRERAIHFMGTVILFQESSPKQNIQPRDDRALPTRIDNVIDGQQRISTIALLACVLLQRLLNLRSGLPGDAKFDSLRTEIDSKRDLLLELFSVDIKRGSPSRKPIIVRGSVDGWTFDGTDEDNYKSGVASYIASTIRAYTNNSLGKLAKPNDKRVARNVREIEKWLKKIEETGPSDDNDYPRAKQILETIPEESLWTYPRPELRDHVPEPTGEFDKVAKVVSSLVQLFAFIHYFAERCCFTVIKPVSEEWAFDMFQSLNASGTPLTAIETFKPLVVNYLAQEGKIFKDTKSNEYFSKVDQLIGDTGPAAKKNKLTDEFLTIFALTHDGHTLSTQFSLQRRYLNDRLRAADTPAAREDFVRQMGELATYWDSVIGFEPNNLLAIAGLEDLTQESKSASGFCVLFLRDSGHKMANSVLSRFYGRLLREKSQQAAIDFVEACKAVTAFYFLWRAAKTNSGLDDVYRKLLRAGDEDNGIPPLCALKGQDSINIENLQKYFRLALDDLADRTQWLTRATQNLRYDFAKPMCKCALFLSAHDTIPDSDSPGLMKLGTPGTHPMIDPRMWNSPDFKSIEHIAPGKGQGNWDDSLYESERFQAIGNLTLLPGEVNSSAGNSPWVVKSIYYRHLAEKDPEKLVGLAQEAEKIGVVLQAHTLDLLKNSSYSHHMESIVRVPTDGKWDKDLVELRSRRICELSWSRVASWLGLPA